MSQVPGDRVRRLVGDYALPAYAYVPGQHPHPTSDPAGHSYARHSPPPPPIEPASWRDSRAYLVGCDLFNYGYYWEAHEEWESLWKACGRRGPTADFLKGLIKLAAAGVKLREGRPEGVRRHSLRAIELITAARREFGSSRILGLDVEELLRDARVTADGAKRAGGAEAAHALLDSRLLPAD